MVRERWGQVPTMSHAQQELAYIGLGVAGEAGEVADEIKKRLRTDGDRRDPEVLKRECGDVLFYLQRLFDVMGWTQEEVELCLMAKIADRAKINPKET